ncbi:hypothetical protein [Sinomonas sp.]|jgi:hypothetical protein|uniref:hypothetical protein n=1 Tax=Sinomonas sp. TaxID=1914986 RepID=UPI002C3AD963|nr:hypothetical protein [Sinomonas sp.]
MRLPRGADRPRSGRTATLTEAGSLRIELQDAGSETWWARVFYLLASQNGQTQLRFIGTADDGRTLYRGETFPSPPLGARAPEEAWAPGLEASLAKLKAEVTGDGWIEAWKGPKPWDLVYVRPVPSAGG